MNMNSETSWLIEQRVYHSDFGFGTIIKIRFGGIHAYVRFHNGIHLWVRTADLKFLDPGRSQQKTPTIEKASLPDRVTVLQMLEAFKLGIVPAQSVPYFTFGRDKQIEQIRDILHQLESGGAVVLVEGPYGSGKTHFATYVEYLALSQGFAVARADLDPVEVSPSKPKRIYRALMSTLRWQHPDGGMGTFDDAFEQLIDIPGEWLQDHRYFEVFHQMKKLKPTAGQLSILKEWLSGELLDRTDLNRSRFRHLPLLYDHTTAADHLGYLLSGWSRFFRLLGLKGFLLIFDEAETVFNYAHWFEKHRGLNTLQGLIDIARGQRDTLLQEPLHYDPHRRCYIDEAGRVHSGLKPLPYAYQLPAYLGVMFTITPVVDSWYSALKDAIPEKNHLILWNLLTDDYRTITHYVYHMYRMTYPEVNMDHADIESLFQSLKGLLWTGSDPPNPRLFIKALIEALEIRRKYKHIPWSRLSDSQLQNELYRII